MAAPSGEVEVEEASVEGVIVVEPRGNGGFGYDPYFRVPSFGRTMAELTASEKDGISHRGLALRRALPHVHRMLETMRERSAAGRK